MTIWILTLVLLACLAGLGYRQGAIRVAFSLIGIIVAALLAVPLGRFARPIVGALGVKDPILLWVLGPFVVFCVILIAFKVAGFAVHHKVDVFYKYKAGDLRLSLWERLNSRLGVCLGLVNGMAYLVLLSLVFYWVSYWTVQLSSGDDDAQPVRLSARLGHDMEKSGMTRVARSIDGMDASFYDVANLAGLLYQNPLLEARLSRYPAFLAASERDDFKTLGDDKNFVELRLRHAPLREVLTYPPIKQMMDSPETLHYVWDLVTPVMGDLLPYLETGKTVKYDGEPLIGRWRFDLNSAIAAYRKARPNVPATEMQKYKRYMASIFESTSMVVFPDNKLLIKNVPAASKPPAAGQPISNDKHNYTGDWTKTDGGYEFKVGTLGERMAKLDNNKLTLTGEGLAMAFSKQE